MKNLIARYATLAVLCLSAISCGSQPKVLTNIAVQTSTVNNDVMVAVSADLDLGAMSLPAVSFPILDPRGQAPIGSVDLIPVLGGKNQIKINLDVSAIIDIHPSEALLPNGTSIPLIANNSVVVLDLGRGAKLYMLLSQTATAVGVAIPISSFDAIGRNAPGINIFPVANFKGIMATAGMFLSANAGQNGIAVVADLSSVFKLPSGDPAPTTSTLLAMQAEESRDADAELDYSSQIAPASAKKKIDSMLLTMNNKKTKLKL